MKTGQSDHRVVLVLRDLFLLATFLFIHGFVVFPVTAGAGTPLIQVSQYTGGSIKQHARGIEPVEWRALFMLAYHRHSNRHDLYDNNRYQRNDREHVSIKFIISGQVQFTAVLLLFRNNPDGVNKTWNITTKS